MGNYYFTILTLKTGLGFIQAQRTIQEKWHHLIDRVWVPIRLPYQPWRYLVSFARYSDLLVENRANFIPHLYLAPPQGVTPSEFREDLGIHKTRMNGLSCGEEIMTIRSAVLILSSPHDSLFILVLCVSRSSRNADGVTCGVRKCRNFRQITRYISETVEDRWVHACSEAFDKHWIVFPTVWHLPRLSQGRT